MPISDIGRWLAGPILVVLLGLGPGCSGRDEQPQDPHQAARAILKRHEGDFHRCARYIIGAQEIRHELMESMPQGRSPHLDGLLEEAVLVEVRLANCLDSFVAGMTDELTAAGVPDHVFERELHAFKAETIEGILGPSVSAKRLAADL